MARVVQRIDGLVGELTPCSFSLPLTVPDGFGSTRYPTDLEMATAELSVTAGGTIVNALDAVALLPGHGSYTEATGVLVITLEAADNPIIDTSAEAENHVLLAHVPELLWVELTFRVRNQALIP